MRKNKKDGTVRKTGRIVCVCLSGGNKGEGEKGKKRPFYVLLLYIYVVLAQAGKVCVDSFDEE